MIFEKCETKQMKNALKMNLKNEIRKEQPIPESEKEEIQE